MTKRERQRRRIHQLWEMRCVEFKTLLILQRRERDLNAQLKTARREVEHTRRKLKAYKERSDRLQKTGFNVDKFFAQADRYVDGKKWIEIVN